jgi:Spx/MgsR family transcriptional regulator
MAASSSSNDAITVYGIPNCDTVKKARAWFAAQGVTPAWHDFKKQGVPENAMSTWLKGVGWEKLLNRQGSTWRKLDDDTKAAVTDADSARAVMLGQPSVIRRPVVRWADGEITVGFSEEVFQRKLG